ncbi:unnamed protein product [Brachionus calyciflorus]|uniref:PLAT domain-containing protein n=1 Tax=Brachionus calyciflorus TaxID=104777 RepID=A0A813MD32_9BILA|nr:unnamed protein product [Brachionus calyciflorus]
MPGFFSKIKGAFSSPSPSRKANKTQNDLSYLPQIYQIKEKELSKLHLAAWKGELERVVELCRPDKINAVDKDGRAPLHLAVAAGHIKIVDHLINEGAKINIVDAEKRTPMIIATIKGNAEMLDLLVKNSQSKNLINQPDQSGINPLLYAIKNENIDILQVLLRCKDLNLDFQDKDKNTAFHYAVIQRQFKLIDTLIENGSDIDKQNADGRTALMLAAKNNDEELVDYLLDYNPDKNLKDNLGHTAQEYAVSSGGAKCASLFTEHRPVKSNVRQMYKNKRSTLDSEKQTSSLSEANKKFENLFAAKKSSQEDEKHDASSKYRITKDQDTQSNTSRNISYNKSDKVDTWGNTEDEDSDDQAENEDGLANLRNIIRESDNKYDALFGKADLTNSNELDSNIEININEDKLYDNSNNWLFQSNKDSKQNDSEPSNNSEFHVLTSFFPQAKPKPEKQESTTSSKNSGSPNWTIYVYTSRIKNAGTDAGVYMQIYGSKSNTTQFFLDDKNNSKKLFELGSCDRFDRTLSDIGKPIKIKIGHDNKGAFPGWHLEKIVLQNNITDEKFVFHCNRWLAKDEADHKTEVELTNETNKKSVSISSWNSDDEDSLSNNFKPSPVKQGILLKQIDEANETIQSSKNDVQNPPAISDFESSDDEKFNNVKFLNSTKKSDQASFNLTNVTPVPNLDNNSALSFLAKNNIPKQQKTDWKNFNFNTRIEDEPVPNQKEELNSSIKFLIENNIVAEPVKSLSDSFDDLVEEFENDYKPKQNNQIKGLNELIREEKDKKKTNVIKDFSDSDSDEVSEAKPFGLTDLLSEEKQKQKSNHDFSDSGFTFPSSNQQPGLKDLMKEEKLKQKSNQDFSDNDFSLSSSDAHKPGLKDLIKEEKNKSQKNDIFSNNPLGLKDLIHEEKQKQKLSQEFSDSDSSFKLPEPQPGLKDLIKEEKNKSTKTDEFSSIGLNFTKNQPGLKELIREEKQKPKLSQEFSESDFSIQSPGRQPGLKELIRSERNSQKSDIVLDEVFNTPRKNEPKSETIEDLEKQFNDVIENKSPIKLLAEASMPPPGFRNETKNSPRKNLKVSFEDSDDDYDDEIESLASPKKTGVIDQGLGAFIGNFKDSPETSPRKPSFYDIVPEMLNEKENKNETLERLRQKNEDLEQTKLRLETLLNETEIQKKNFEIAFNNLDRQLAEKEKLISQMNADKLKNSLTNSLDLNRELDKIKEEKNQLEKQLSAKRSLRNSEDFELINQNESLQVRIKALENQIDELNKDRKILADYKEELIQKIDEQEEEIKNHNEALQIATLQFTVDKKNLNDEILKCKKEMTDLNDLKRNLELLVDNLKRELTEKNLSFEKILLEKNNYEKQAQNLEQESTKNKTNYETELDRLKNEKYKLMERLAIAEAKLINTEKDAHFTSSQIDERHKQIDDLREQLIKSKTEFSIQLNLLQREKEEKEALMKKLNEMELVIQKNLQEISDLKLANLTQQQELKDKNENINLKIENENKKLHSDVKSLSEKLFKTETELEKLKHSYQQQRIEQSYDEYDFPEANETNISKGNKKTYFNDKIHNELQKIRQDFTTIMNKYSNLETSNHELNESVNSLKNLAGVNRNEIVIRRDPVDASAMITEVPLKTLTALNSYLLQNLIQSKEEQSTNDFNSKSALNFNQGNKHEHSQFFTNFSSKSFNCPKCCKVNESGLNMSPRSTSYGDVLKYELSKRIELQVAKELSLSGGFNSLKFKNNTENVDSLYSTMKTNTRYSNDYYSNSNNADLLTSMRSKFLI